MKKEKSEILDSLLESYEAYFDIRRNVEIENLLFNAEAEFHSRSEKYILVKSAKIWAAESNEYAYFLLSDRLAPSDWSKARDAVLQESKRRIKPHKEHMYSFVTLIIIADYIDEDIRREIKRFSYQKNFLFSIHGWMEFRSAALDLSDGSIITNRRGKSLLKVLNGII
ncbi:MAG: hypothetical protein VB120_01510 [Lachnospiraceae bacterium]|nr:hypothetical protein [Lachnospiraceae bacterium]